MYVVMYYLLQLVREADALHKLHVDEAGVLFLDLLELPVGGVGHTLLAVRGHADQVRYNLKKQIRYGTI